MTAGDDMLDRTIQEALDRNDKPSTAQVCPSHEGLRQGMYALLLCEQERRKNGGSNNGEVELLGGKLLSMKGVHITGRDVVLFCIVAIVAIIGLKDVFFR